MVLNEIMISGFAMGLYVGAVASLINTIISAFGRWISSW